MNPTADMEVRFAKLGEAYKAVGRIRDLADNAVWDIRVTPLEGNRGLVMVPQVLLDRQPSVVDILRRHGGISSMVVRGATTDRFGRLRPRLTGK